MLKDWNTMENSNLIERKLLKRVDELPIGTVIYGLDSLNEVNLWVVNKRYGDMVYLYNLSSYGRKTFVVKADDKEVYFKDTEDIQVVKEYFENKTYNSVEINLARNNTIVNDLAAIEPNTNRFYFNTYPVSRKSKKVEVQVEIVDTDYWYTCIPYDTYVLPVFNSDLSRYYPNEGRIAQIAKNVHSELKYRFKNPNEYEVCNYLIYSKDSHNKKLKTLEKLQRLPDNYNVVDIDYNKYSDKITVRIDEAKVDLDTKVSDGAVKLLDLQECHHCNCNTCKYHSNKYSSKEYQSNGICRKNVQIMQNNTPCHLYSPYSLYKVFKTEWDKSTEEDKQTYLDYVKKSLRVNGCRITISREDNVIYYTDDPDKVFDRNPNEVIKADYKETYYSRRKKNQKVVEKL